MAGCVTSYPKVPDSPIKETPIDGTNVPITETPASYGYTHFRPDGNRLMFGHGSLPDSSYFDIRLTGVPMWILGGIPLYSGSEWTGLVWAASSIF